MRILRLETNVFGNWVLDKEFKSIAEVVRFVNNECGIDLKYNRMKYHLTRYKEHQFGRKMDIWTKRILLIDNETQKV